MHHWRQGWCFERQPNGDVEIRHLPRVGETRDVHLTIPADEWVTIVHAMMPPGEGGYFFLHDMHLGKPA